MLISYIIQNTSMNWNVCGQTVTPISNVFEVQ